MSERTDTEETEMLTKQEFNKVNIGAVMVAVSGPGDFPSIAGSQTVGRVQSKVQDTWGNHLIVRLTDGTERQVESAYNPHERKGCGWYLIDNTPCPLFSPEWKEIFDHQNIVILKMA